MTNRLLRKLDIELRNVNIRITWDVLVQLTDMGYKARINYLTKGYNLSYKSIERIVREYSND